MSNSLKIKHSVSGIFEIDFKRSAESGTYLNKY